MGEKLGTRGLKERERQRELGSSHPRLSHVPVKFAVLFITLAFRDVFNFKFMLTF